MTRSIFDPNSGETEQSGSAFTPPRADEVSQLPPDVIDGKVEPEERADHGEEQLTEPSTADADATTEQLADAIDSAAQGDADSPAREAKRSPED